MPTDAVKLRDCFFVEKISFLKNKIPKLIFGQILLKHRDPFIKDSEIQQETPWLFFNFINFLD